MHLHTPSFCEDILEFLNIGASFDYPKDLNVISSLANLTAYSLLHWGWSYEGKLIPSLILGQPHFRFFFIQASDH